MHHLIANHHQILSETVYRNFEVPLLHELDKWQNDVDDEEESYQRAVKTQSKEIRKLEKDGLKLHKQKRRDVAKFRAHLVQLTTKLDGLTSLHADHSLTLLRDSQETSNKILDASCSLVRAEVDIFESLARKGWTGGGLDDLLEKGTDLFAPDELPAQGNPGGEGSKLFSILPPKSILADSGSDSGRANSHRSDALGDGERYQSLAGVASAEGGGPPPPPPRASDSDSIFSDFNRSRGVRPFSPQPIRRTTTGVTFDSLCAGDPSGMLSPNEDDENGDGDGDSDADGAARQSEFRLPTVETDLPCVDESDEHHPWRDERGASSRDESSVDKSSPEDDDRGRSWTDVRDETK